MIKFLLQFIKKNKEEGKNIFWSNFDQFFLTFSALITSLIFTRLSTKEIYGQYTFIVSIITFFSLFSIPGARLVVFRSVAQGLEGVYKKATNFSFLHGIFGIPFIILFGVFLYYIKDPEVAFALILFSFFLPFEHSLKTWVLYWKGKSNFRRFALLNLVKVYTNIFVVILAIIFTQNIFIILASYFLSNAFFHVFYHLQTLKKIENTRLDPSWKSQSYSLSVIDFSSLIFGTTDLVLLGIFLPIEYVAIYGLVKRFCNIFFMVIKTSLEGILPRFFKGEHVYFRNIYFSFLIAFLIPLILFPLLEYPIVFLYGLEYIDVVHYSQIYVFIIPFFFLTTYSGYYLIREKKSLEINIIRWGALLVTFLIYFFSIPYIGIWGGILGAFAYYFFSSVLSLYFLHFPYGFKK